MTDFVHENDRNPAMNGLRTASCWITLLAILLPMLGCSSINPKPQNTAERLQVFPQSRLPLEGEVTIYWNHHQVPFIRASTDRDLAFTLGLVHAHLRSGQMALLKRISQGRISEMAGPFSTKIDEALKILDFGYASASVFERMAPESQKWLQAFVDGLNYYQNHTEQRPPEFGLLGVRPEPWTVEDVLTFSRLAGTDVNWLIYFSLLRERLEDNWPRVWAQTLEVGAGSSVSFASEPQMDKLARLLSGFSRSGSNSIVLSPSRMGNRAGAIANDPHLGISLPNFWLIAGVKSPSYHAVGLMVPGLPFIAVGRNPHLAWGGTNMRAASSDLYDVSRLPPEDIQTVEKTIKVRFGFDKSIRIRRTPFGPILSDAELIPAGPEEVIALRWMGHEPSDELTAFLRANRAGDVHEFRAAFESYSISGQNMLAVDDKGSIAMVLAARLPIRSSQRPEGLVLDATNPEHDWKQFTNAIKLPWQVDPPEGFIASANNRPTDTPFPISFFYGQSERIERLQELFGKNKTLTFDRLREIQLDVYSKSSLRLAKTWARQIAGLDLQKDYPDIFDPLNRWEGRYDADADEPVVFELLTYHLSEQFLSGSRAGSAHYRNWDYTSRYMAEELSALPGSERLGIFKAALDRTRKDMKRFSAWGDMHRLQAHHLLGNLPLLGRFFRYGDMPVSGSRETVMKTNHSLIRERSGTRYGQQARHISLMDDPDHNYFVLFGGQDGWLGSKNLTDQIELWRAGEFIRVPLRLETLRREFRFRMVLSPKHEMRLIDSETEN